MGSEDYAIERTIGRFTLMIGTLEAAADDALFAALANHESKMREHKPRYPTRLLEKLESVGWVAANLTARPPSWELFGHISQTYFCCCNQVEIARNMIMHGALHLSEEHEERLVFGRYVKVRKTNKLNTFEWITPTIKRDEVDAATELAGRLALFCFATRNSVCGEEIPLLEPSGFSVRDKYAWKWFRDALSRVNELNSP